MARGRKPGAVTKKTREIAERAHEEGISPLEVMVLSVREAWQQFQDTRQPEWQDKAVAWAEKAAPYMHPRLGSITHKGDAEAPIEHKVTHELGDTARALLEELREGIRITSAKEIEHGS